MKFCNDYPSICTSAFYMLFAISLAGICQPLLPSLPTSTGATSTSTPTPLTRYQNKLTRPRPDTGYTKKEYFAAKFGPAGLPGFFSRVEAGGRALGIDFDFAGRTGTTRDSHKLLLLAQRRGSPGVVARLQDALFGGQFEGAGRDISDRAFLAQAAVASGLARSEEEAWRCLDSEGAGREADGSDREAKRMGVTAVPSYLVQGRYRVGGFQEPEFLVGLFEKIGAAESSPRSE